MDDIEGIIRRCTDGGGGSGVAAFEVVRYLHVNGLSDKVHVHRWDILGIKPEASAAIHPRMNFRPFTVVLVRCSECGWPETTELDGLWTLDQITGAAKPG